MLRCVTSVLKSKRHPQELVHPKGGDDGGLLDVLLSHRDPVITLLESSLENTVKLLILEVKTVMFGRR